jgi:hypothetical protein
MSTNYIAQTLSSVVFGPEVTFENLTMVPLLRRDQAAPLSTPRTPDYVLLDDALTSGVTEISEVSEQGSVPELRVVNKGAHPVLIVDGEELVGAKQNRVVNLTILVPAASELTIPVSCVEAGRWRFRSKKFASAPRTQYTTGRARKMAQVTASMRDAGVHRSDQAEVWQHIAEKSARLGASSPTSAMEALFTTHAESIDQFVAACRPVDRQVGALFAVNGRIAGFDLFDRPATLQKVLPKLVRAVAIDALDSGEPLHAPAAQPDLARLFLGAVAAAPAHVTPALGLGDDVRASAPGLTGAALLVDAGVVHLSAFAV